MQKNVFFIRRAVASVVMGWFVTFIIAAFHAVVAKHLYFIGCTVRTPRLELCARELLVVVVVVCFFWMRSMQGFKEESQFPLRK